MHRWVPASLVALVACLALAGGGAGATLDDLRRGDVAVQPGAMVEPGERRRLEELARSLRARGHPTEFVLASAAVRAPEREANRLRRRLDDEGTVIVLTPADVGIASALPDEVEWFLVWREARLLEGDRVGALGHITDALAPPAERPGGGPVLPLPFILLALAALGVAAAAAFIGPIPTLLAEWLIRMVLAWRRERARATPPPPDASVGERIAVHALAAELAARVEALEPAIRARSGPRPGEARRAYERALLTHGEVAGLAASATAGPVVDRMRTRLEEGLRDAARARAAIDGEPWPPAEMTSAAEAHGGA